jgi:hypothetical protein
MSRLFLEIFKPVDSQVMERKNEHTAKDWAFTLEAVWAVGLFDASPTLHPFQTLNVSVWDGLGRKIWAVWMTTGGDHGHGDACADDEYIGDSRAGCCGYD